MEIKKRLGKRIQELRYKNNLKQSELAEKVGIATKSQSCIETGKNYPSAELIEKYAKEFGLDISDILNIESIKTPQQLLNEINSMLCKANEQEIQTIYKIVKNVLF